MMDYSMADIPALNTAIAECTSCMLTALMGKRKKRGKEFVWITALFYLVQYAYWALFPHSGNIIWISKMMMGFLLMLGYLFFCMDTDRRGVLYLTLVAFNAAEFVSLFERAMYVFFLWQRELITPWADEFLFLLLVYLFFFRIFWVLFRRAFSQEERLNVSKSELGILVFAALFSFVLSNISFSGLVTPFTFYGLEGILPGRMIVAFSGFVVTYAVNLQRAEYRAKTEILTMEELLRSQYLQYEQSKESIELIHYAYHDLKHQIQVLRNETDWKKKEIFLNELEENVHMYEAGNDTGNKVADTILTGKSLVCVKEGIELNCVVDGKAFDFLRTMDLCSILGNALDNAIECEKKIEDQQKRLIHVAVFSEKQFTIMRFENYFEGELKLENGMPVTTKRRKEYHGYGMRSIRYVVEKYGGNVNFEVKDNWFILKILIPKQNLN